MLVVDTYLKEFKGKGIGLVANQDIEKSQVMWTYNSTVDIEIDKKSVPKEAADFYNKYAVDHGGETIFLSTDNARFVNHSKSPNMKSLGNRKDNIAIRNISKGEEITIDYSEIDVNKADFEEVES